jgi:hypothetical protein
MGIEIDESMTADEIDALGLSLRQLELCFEGGSLSHLSGPESDDLIRKARARDVAGAKLD